MIILCVLIRLADLYFWWKRRHGMNIWRFRMKNMYMRLWTKCVGVPVFRMKEAGKLMPRTLEKWRRRKECVRLSTGSGILSFAFEGRRFGICVAGWPQWMNWMRNNTDGILSGRMPESFIITSENLSGFGQNGSLSRHAIICFRFRAKRWWYPVVYRIRDGNINDLIGILWKDWFIYGLLPGSCGLSERRSIFRCFGSGRWFDVFSGGGRCSDALSFTGGWEGVQYPGTLPGRVWEGYDPDR